MTGVLVLLAILSAVGGFIALPHFLEPQLPLPPVHESLEHFETPLLVLSVVLALAGLGGATLLYGGSSARVDALALRFATPLRWLSHKYYIDELYEKSSASRWSGFRTSSSCASPTASCSTARSTAWVPSDASAAACSAACRRGA